MIERLNFYDAYGYLIPGIIFLALICVPFILVTQQWAPKGILSVVSGLLSVIVGLVFGYVLGTILQGIASKAFISKMKDNNRKLRYPSDVFLDKDDKHLSPEVKDCLVKKIQKRFGINVREKDNERDEGFSSLKKRRKDAFMLCRRSLILKKAPSYAEQFEGMYVLMRGLIVAFILGGCFNLGWGISIFFSFCTRNILGPVMLGGIIFIILFQSILIIKPLKKRLLRQDKKKDNTKLQLIFGKLIFGALALILLLLGIFVGLNKNISCSTAWLLLGIFSISLFISLRSYSTYQKFTRLFALTIYRDFCA